MARVFEDKNIILTENQKALLHIDGRLNSLKVNDPGSAEVGRFSFIREDVMSRMSDDEKARYIELVTRVETPADIRARMERERKAMEENRDKPSI